mmetsp:Transcript_54868/g.129656  ORF Transcript_54868/g.129656 Transcript_54868/m.129656 type:complete len:205 (-) Transcript_54868:363-977(-)
MSCARGPATHATTHTPLCRDGRGERTRRWCDRGGARHPQHPDMSGEYLSARQGRLPHRPAQPAGPTTGAVEGREHVQTTRKDTLCANGGGLPVRRHGQRSTSCTYHPKTRASPVPRRSCQPTRPQTRYWRGTPAAPTSSRHAAWRHTTRQDSPVHIQGARRRSRRTGRPSRPCSTRQGLCLGPWWRRGGVGGGRRGCGGGGTTP